MLFGELATDEVEDKLAPGVFSVFFKIILNGHRNDPFAAMLVLWVFPLGSDTLLEEQVICVRDYFRHAVEVIIHVPEVFNLQDMDKRNGLNLFEKDDRHILFVLTVSKEYTSLRS